MTLAGARALVLGGAGNIGSHVVELLLDEGLQVTVYDNFARGKLSNLAEAQQRGEVTIIEGDIRDRGQVHRACEGQDYVFLLASAWLLQCLEQPRLSLDVNVVGTYNVLEAAAATGVKKVIFSSSASVFGDPSYLPVDERHPFNTNTAYGASKVAGEQYCQVFWQMHGLPYVALRYFNVYGPRQDVKGAFTQVIPKWLDRIEAGQPLVIYGNGSQTMDLVYVRDCARANILAMRNTSLTHAVYNIGNGIETSLKQLAEELSDLCGVPHNVIYEPSDKHLVQRRQADITTARRELGFEPVTPLREGLAALIAWRRTAVLRPEI